MSQVDAPRGRTCSRTLRSVALLTSGVLALPVLAGCSADESERTGKALAPDIAAATRGKVADGGTLRWAVDAMPSTLNAFQADADAATAQIAGAVLPALFTLDENGRPQRNPDFLESAKIVDREPKQVVLYKLNQKAVWSDGREIGAPDFVAQWRALSGKDSAFWTARNAGYERIEEIQKGASDLEVKVTFKKPYADWQALFSPLYPKEVTASPNAFNDGARNTLKTTAGPFRLDSLDRKAGKATLVRNPRWWGQQAKLDSLVLTAVPREKRAAALAAGSLDVAEIDRGTADRIVRAAKVQGANGRPNARSASAAPAPSALKSYVVRKSLEPAYTQLALNGESGPLADVRVRRAVARALDREELAETVLDPLGLPADPPGSHLALAGQRAYTDNSGALGDQNTQEAQALLADAGWTPGGAVKKPAPAKAGPSGSPLASGSPSAAPKKAKPKPKESENSENKAADTTSDEGTYVVGDDKPAGGHGPESGGTRVVAPAPATDSQDMALQRRAGSVEDEARGAAQDKKGGAAGAYAPRGTAAPAAAGSRVGKDGKPLVLRFVLPSGPGSEPLRAVGEKIARMLDRVGIDTEITKVADSSYFKDHIASGNYDLAVYSWPASAYPATDARPIFAKPEPATDGSLLVEQNYTRVGSDYIDQLFDQAASELDQDEARDLVRRADARIWAAAGSIPLYQRPDVVAAKRTVLNAGAFGFTAPRYQDIGFKKSETSKATAR